LRPQWLLGNALQKSQPRGLDVTFTFNLKPVCSNADAPHTCRENRGYPKELYQKVLHLCVVIFNLNK
jgi:hypothetical protein